MSNESERMAASIRSIAGKPEERATFITEGVRKARDLQGKNVQDFENVVSTLIMSLESFDVVHGASLDIMCELTVLDVLLSLDLSAIQVSLCTSYIGLCLKGVPDCTVAVVAAKTFAEALTFSSATEFARTQVEEALTWISLTQPNKRALRVCGMLVLTEVSLRIPMMVMPKLGVIFEKLWDGLSSPDAEVRPRSLFLFSLCTKLLASRPPAARTETLDALMRVLKTMLASKSKNKQVAGLLAFEPIVMNSSINGATGSSLRYEHLSLLLVPFIIGSGSGTDVDIRELIFRCLVVLCRFSTPLFIANQLKDTVRFALDSVRQNVQRGMAFEMISEIVPIVGAKEYEPFVEETCGAVNEVFVESESPCWEALRCFSIICKVCPSGQMDNYVDACVERVFSWGLSAQLIESMRNIIASSSDDYRVKLEESLLDMISLTLCDLPFRQQTGEERVFNFSRTSEPSEYQISIALNALMQFGFSNSELMGDFLRDSVLPFIDNSSAAVRNAAIYTIVKLLIPPAEKGDLSIARRMCVNTVTSQMLVVGLSNPNPVVRQTILSAFTEDFYPYLSEPQFLFRFYSALGDESINCRAAALEQICHMIKYDPSHILPPLRDNMIVVLHFISSNFNMDTVQNGLRLLTAMAVKAPQFVTKFTDGIVNALQPYFSSIGARTPIMLPFLHCCTAVVKAVHLFCKDKIIFASEIPSVCELFNALPTDRSYHAARLCCLRFLSATLGPLIDGETPYKLFPSLFEVLSRVLQRNDESNDLRVEALKCLGTIGALDAHVFQSITLPDEDNTSSDAVVVFNSVTHQKCCRVVLRAIARQLDPNEKRSSSVREGLLRTCVQTILNIAERCPCSKYEMPIIIAPVARVLCQLGGGRLFATILYEFSNIIRFTGERSLQEVSSISAVFDEVWEHQRTYRFLAVRMLSIVSSFASSGNYRATQQQAGVLPRLFDSLRRIDSSADLKYTILEYIVRHADTLQGCCECVIDNLLSVIQSPTTAQDILNAAVTTLKVVCTKLYVDELVGSIVRCLLVCMANDFSRPGQAGNPILFANVMGVFCALCEDLQNDFLKYSFYVTQTLKTYRIGHAEFNSLLAQISSGGKCARSAKALQQQNAETLALLRTCDSIVAKSMSKFGEVWSYSVRGDDPAVNTGDSSSPGSPSPTAAAGGAEEEQALPIGESKVLAFVRTTPLTREEWVKWADQFCVSVLQESPFQVFRCTSLPIGLNATPLVERSPQFVLDVVQVAFRTLWTYASANLRSCIVEFLRQSFRQTMESSLIPDEVLTLQLSIVEYMDHVGETLSVSYTDLSECAWGRGMLAKALFWREAAYREDPVSTVESLISLYSELHMVDSSVGVLNQASVDQRRSLLQSSLVKLAHYTQALQLTQQELSTDTAANATVDNNSYEGSHLFDRGSLTTPGHSLIKGSYRGTTFSRKLHYGTSSDISSSFVHSSDELLSSRRLEATARLMLCLSELGNYDKVLEEWLKLYLTCGGASAAVEPMHIEASSPLASPAVAAGVPDSAPSPPADGSSPSLASSPQGSTAAVATEVQSPLARGVSVISANASVGANAAAVSAANVGTPAPPDDGNILTFVSQYAADAAIRLQSWDALQSILRWIPQDTVQYHVSKACLSILNEDYDDALDCVAEGRKMLLEDLSGLLHESYARAYEGLVIAQELTEIEEVVTAKRWQTATFSSDTVTVVSKLWDARIRMMAPTVPAWKQVLGIRGLLIPPSEDVNSRLRFVKLCRQENAKQQEKFALDQVLGYSNPTYEQLTSRSANPRVVMQYITYLSASSVLGADSPYGTEIELLKKVIDVHSKAENAQILSRAYARLGSKIDDLEEAVESFKAATLYDPKWYLGWRMWAEACTELLSSQKEFSATVCSNAIEGYIHSIQLGTSDSTLIQDVLKLLTLWSKHCDREQGLEALRNRILDVPSHVWHLVVPQLIARLDSGSDESCHLVADLITGLAYDYPFTLLYPLNLCTMSDSERRRKWANEIIAKLQVRYPVIVLQGRLVVSELVRVSAMLHEQWYDKLEAAATAYFGRHSNDEMMRILLPMHETLTRVPETIVESEFIAKYSRALSEAKEWMRSYSSTRNVGDLQAAWNLYHGVYRMMDEQIKANNVLKMQFCSPKLFEARDLAIGMPDMNAVNDDAISRISSFHENLYVIVSKQRPKRIGLTTNDGRSQKFLLKGREDLRLDERVMQLFGLVNILMLSDSRSCQQFGFQIQRYSVTPLKDTVGLIGWVDACDTLHEMVKFYREKKGIQAELEMRMLNQIITYDNAKAYDYLAIMSKVEVMEFLADHTSGHDIRKAMWAVAPNCETWMDQRQMFTTSLANMSIVGYILGLGDRHPNNIMIQKSTGLIVHIDFGDCFEVAMTRDKFPEKVPFRLTRMLRNALGVSGVDGAFRANAETVMCVLREGSHSVLALMEAFLQDPLISWRLVNRTGEEPESSNAHKTIDEQLSLAGIHRTAMAQSDSVAGSVEVGRRGMESLSVAKHLFGEEVDVVHQGVFIFNRLSSKLKGQDFITADGAASLDSATQVGRLIEEATDIMNVAQSWSGWYPFW